MKENTKGITLIALVITIIVLLILAGVSIAMLTGQNGILTQAQNAKNETERAQIKEEIQRKILEEQVNNQGEIDENTFNSILTSYGTVSENEEGEKILTTTQGPYEIPVKEIYGGSFAEDTNIPVERIDLQSELEMRNEETYQLTATVYPENATNKNVIWESRDPGMLSVDQTGKVTASKEGVIEIVVTSEANPEIQAVCEVTIKAPIS